MSTRDLNAAGLHDYRMRTAYAACADYLGQRNSAAYPAARCLLPPDRRPYWDAILAFATYIDDVIDDPHLSPHQRAEQYDAYRQDFLRLMAGDDPWSDSSAPVPDRLFRSHLIARAFQHFVRTWDIPQQSVQLFLDTIRTDLHVTEYPTYVDLERYIFGVCAQGSMWGNALLLPHSEDAAARSVAMSFGLQLTDYLHDLREDLGDGRLYLPLEDLERLGLRRSDVEDAAMARRMTEPLRALVAFEVDRARRHLEEAADWWRLVHPLTRELPRQYVRLGRHTLEQIAHSDFDIFRTRRGRRLAGIARASAGLACGYLRATGTRLLMTGRTVPDTRPVGAKDLMQ